LAGSRAGFTLVELLVVLVISGIVAGLVLLRLPAIGSDDPERLLQRLDAELESICDRALLTGNARGLRFHDRGYDFWRREAGRWLPAEQPPAREWPRQIIVDLDIDGLGGALGSLRGDAELPQILCTGIEPATPFRLRLTLGGDRSELVWPP
jgi:type II secretion system protein H